MDLELRTEQRDEGIVTLWLDSPKRRVVVLDGWLLDQLHLFLDKLEAGPAPSGLIIMSAKERVFVAGADLAEIDSLSDDALHGYLTEGAEAFNRIAQLPCPTVAAIDGAALGGGLELAMHCDALVAAKPLQDDTPYRIGLPEAGLGLCPGWGGTQMLPARIDPAAAIEMMVIGHTPAITDFPDGLFDRVIENEADLHEAATVWIEDCEKPGPRRAPMCIDQSNRDRVRKALESVRDKLPDTPAANAVVEAVEIGIEEGWAAGAAAERRLLVSLRRTPAARAKLDAFFARSA